jgi:hypothetical protein
MQGGRRIGESGSQHHQHLIFADRNATAGESGCTHRRLGGGAHHPTLVRISGEVEAGFRFTNQPSSVRSEHEVGVDDMVDAGDNQRHRRFDHHRGTVRECGEDLVGVMELRRELRGRRVWVTSEDLHLKPTGLAQAGGGQ